MLGARRQPVVTLETNCCLDIWRQPVVTIVVKMFCCHYCYPDVWIQPVVSDINKREVGVLSAVSGSESPATEKVVCSGLIYHTHKPKPQFHDTIKSSFLPKLIYWIFTTNQYMRSNQSRYFVTSRYSHTSILINIALFSPSVTLSFRNHT